ncbi:MAG: type ISP restriction/modification enzyme [candidate division Zixibacteria bacterium]|nr:type ISP restriction/modification enzyme [candidate division Zixibacteria bacterium]
MAKTTRIKPTHKAIKNYYSAIEAFKGQRITYELAIKTAFQSLLSETGRSSKWTLIPELQRRNGYKSVIPDGTFRDEYYMERGYWEAKDAQDDLDVEIKKKIAKGYPISNTIFEDSRTAILFQNGKVSQKADLTKPQELCDLLNNFFSFTEPAYLDFNKAVSEFKLRVPELAKGLVEKIEAAHKNNKEFKTAFADFFELCKTSLNPNLSKAAVDEMLVQHLLTERLIRRIFDNADFTRRNVIANEIEKVIDALTSHSFNRDEFLKSLDRFYVAIESAASTIEDFSGKQHFLNVIYERFFQGYSVKTADTHGIVYTPQEIVDFMCASVEEVLKSEFGKTLGSKEVNILDPCTGTGNFIVNIMRRIPKRHLEEVYKNQLFANEVMLMPYYIAALNIEHAYYDLTGKYEPFEGLCFVDTLELAETSQQRFGFMAKSNTTRVERQKKTPITVIIGNPPYNVGQLNENDNNKNRKYPHLDQAIRNTYAKDSSATNKNALSDMYVKFFRWAVDRLGDRDGVLCFVSNNGFVDGAAFDGFRKRLASDFTKVYHIDLHGNVRKNPKLSGTTHNVFGIQVGVGITLCIRTKKTETKELKYHRVPEDWRKEQKLGWLAEMEEMGSTPVLTLPSDKTGSWKTSTNIDTYRSFTSIGSKLSKKASKYHRNILFGTYSRGIQSCRDKVVYNFNESEVLKHVDTFIKAYNNEVDRYKRSGSPKPIDNFVDYSQIKWDSTLKLHIQRYRYASFNSSATTRATYRPFTSKFLYFDPLILNSVHRMHYFFPRSCIKEDNLVIVVSDIGYRAHSFSTLCVDKMPELHLASVSDSHQCFPFYSYNTDGTNRKENITDWARDLFRTHYKQKSISKWDIFYYVYGVLHHPGYRETFAENLRRELPRIPFAESFDDFTAFRKAGEKLSKLHTEYEELKPWDLTWVENEKIPLSYRVEKMRLSKDKTQVQVNDFLTLSNIPPEVFEYRLGNRSALDWVIDQYKVAKDKEGSITSDPNREDDPEYIVRLIGQVVRVSVETVEIVRSLPKNYGSGMKTAAKGSGGTAAE